MTDREIETLIGRAAAKTRRRAWSHYSSEVAADRNGLGQTETDGNFRFSVAPESSEYEERLINILKPLVGESVGREYSDLAAEIKQFYDLDVPVEDIRIYAGIAAAQNRSENTKRLLAANRKRAFDHLEDNSSYFYFFRQSGENMVINPGKEYEGQEVSGSFISENFRKYSVKRPQGKKESDKQYRKYLQKRREKLDSAEGRGFYFTRDKNKAEGYKTENGKLFEVYLRLQKPLNPDELTITKAEVEKIIRAIDTDGTYVADYAENDIGYPGKMWHNKAVKRTVEAIYNS